MAAPPPAAVSLPPAEGFAALSNGAFASSPPPSAGASSPPSSTASFPLIPDLRRPRPRLQLPRRRSRRLPPLLRPPSPSSFLSSPSSCPCLCPSFPPAISSLSESRTFPEPEHPVIVWTAPASPRAIHRSSSQSSWFIFLPGFLRRAARTDDDRTCVAAWKKLEQSRGPSR